MRIATLLASILLALPAAAAVPGEVDYQGLLLDSGGSPVNGVIDLEFEIFDAPSGGSSLWFESHDDVSVVDGVYDVTLGQTTPLTPELLAGGSLHLEITVEGETLSPRERIVAVPYALRAAHAESVESVDGIDAVFVSQLFQHVEWDGGNGPPNDDPREGFADIDGDGRANFIDPDNDGDGLSDFTEENQGTDMNLPTPQIASLTPDVARGDLTTLVTVQGNAFVSGFTVEVDGDPLTPMNATSTSFEVELGPQPAPADVDLVVTNPGGQTDSASFHFRGRFAFVSSAQTTQGDDGLAGADAFCQGLADAAGFGGTFLAWLSDSGTSPAARFSPANLGWERVDGVKIADDLADLTDGSLDAVLNRDEYGVLRSSAIANVFTGTAVDGTGTGADCSDWSSTSGSATAGMTGASDGRWTDVDVLGCGASARLYCFEQD